jgi:hypothetical protein
MALNDQQNNQVDQFCLPLVSPLYLELDQCNIHNNKGMKVPTVCSIEQVRALDL